MLRPGASTSGAPCGKEVPPHEQGAVAQSSRALAAVRSLSNEMRLLPDTICLICARRSSREKGRAKLKNLPKTLLPRPASLGAKQLSFVACLLLTLVSRASALELYESVRETIRSSPF